MRTLGSHALEPGRSPAVGSPVSPKGELYTATEPTMPPFPKPKFQYTYDVSAEIDHLRQHKLTRGVPAKAQDRLLIATWNIANFGVQERTGDDRHSRPDAAGRQRRIHARRI